MFNIFDKMTQRFMVCLFDNLKLRIYRVKRLYTIEIFFFFKLQLEETELVRTTLGFDTFWTSLTAEA